MLAAVGLRRTVVIADPLGGAGERTKPLGIANTIHRWAELRATPRNLISSGVLWLLSAAGVVALQRRVAAVSGGHPVPDVVPFYSPEQLSWLLDQYGAVGRRAFLQFTLYDALYPFAANGFALRALPSQRCLAADAPIRRAAP